MKTALLSLFLTLACFCANSQSFVQYYADVANSCNQDSVTKFLEEFEDLGVKEYNTVALQNTRDWLLDKYSQWGYTDVVQDNFVVFGNTTLNNIIVTKTGTVYPNTYVIIDAHYDTQNGTGTNDNGSGTAILLEFARLIKDIPTEYSIKIIHFSGEEIGLTGSSHYVDNVVIPSNMNIKVLFNIDQVGGVNGMLNNTIVCERDESWPSSNDAQSADMTNQLAVCTELYSNLETEISFAYASDYVPFMSNDYIVTGFYEKNETPHGHTPSDSIAYVDLDYIYQLSKAAMGAMLHYAIAYEEVGIGEIAQNAIELYPNPVDDVLTVLLSDQEVGDGTLFIYDLAGSLVKTVTNLHQESFQLDVSFISEGAYLLKIDSSGGSRTARFLKR